MTKEIKYSPYKETENMLIEWFQQKHEDEILVNVTVMRKKGLKSVTQLVINHCVASYE
jgi:hypothetical protein